MRNDPLFYPFNCPPHKALCAQIRSFIFLPDRNCSDPRNLIFFTSSVIEIFIKDKNKYDDTQRVEHGKQLIPSLFPQDMYINENAIMNNLMKT